MNAETIKDFLVSLGFQVDQSGQHKFEQTLASVTLKAAAMATAVEATALSVVAFTAKIASGLDNLYWASQRTGATVAGIQAIGYAASQVGGSVEGARSSLESLARFMRNNPGSEGFLNRLGVQTRDARGHMMDMSSIFTGVGQRLSQMPYYRANQFAQMLGIDENTLMAMRRGMGTFSAQYSQMAKAIGYNADTAARQSNVFMTSLRSFGLMAGMARDKIGSTLAGGLAGSIDNLRRQVVDNFPKIEGAITTGANGILWLANILNRVIFRLIESAGAVLKWWNSLDSGTRRVIEAVAALAVAWRVINSAFLASPIGRIIALGSAIALLFEDYKTWKEGGQSLIDWQKWKPQIDNAVKGIKSLESSILKLFGIDPKKWTGEWDFSNLTKNLGDFGKMLNYIAEMLNAIKDGRWKDAYAAGKALLNQHSDTTTDALPGVSSSADSVADWIQSKTGFDTRSIGRFFTGNRPQPTKDGAALLGWLQPTFQKLEQIYRLPEGLLRSVAITESAGNPNAMSGAGAQGLFQLMPGTARDLGLRGGDAFDPVKSAQAAAKYLSQLMRANGGDLSKTLASYNWGIGNVQKYGMALMPQETRNYVPRVLSNMPSGGAPQISQETNIHIHGVTDPGQAGKAVVDQQTSVNSRLGQTLAAGPR